MENYLLDRKLDEIPKISLNAGTHRLEFVGKSWPENTVKLYAPVLDWLERYKSYLGQPGGSVGSNSVLVKFEFEYLNSATSVMLRRILDAIKAIQVETKVNIKVEWHYVELDDDIFGLGRELEMYSELSFVFFPIQLEDY